MTGPSVARIAGLERRVMDHLWDDTSGERWFTVREVHEELAREREIAYTTVMTVLQRLARKRLALEAREGRAYLYRSTASRGSVTADLMREALDGAGPADRTQALTLFVQNALPTDVAVLRDASAGLARRATRQA